MRNLSWILVGLLVLPFPPGAPAQNPAAKLDLVIVEGEGAINNIRQRTAREPVVQVDDENHRPVAGAVILFSVPARGAGGEFPGGAHTLSVTTDAQGRAAAHGLIPNRNAGQFQIHVSATYNGVTASAVITQTNAVAGAGSATVAASHGKLIAILAVAAAAAAGGAYWATHTGGSSTPSNPGTTISAGTGTVGAPR